MNWLSASGALFHSLVVGRSDHRGEPMNTRKVNRSKVLKIGGLSIAALSLILGLVFIVSAQRENLLANPGFETPDPTNWQSKDDGFPPLWSYSWLTTPVHSGNRSAGISINTDASAYEGWWQSMPLISTTTGTPYIFSGWIKTQGVTNQAFLSLIFLNADDEEIMTRNSGAVSGSTDWVQVWPSAAVVAPSNAVAASIRCQLSGSGDAWYDDILLTSSPSPEWRTYFPLSVRHYCHPLTNGDFENGWVGWTHGGVLAQNISSGNPHTGNFAVLLGDPVYNCTGGVPVGSAWVEQLVPVPSVASPQLIFLYNIFTHDKNSSLGDTYDSFDVKINGNLVFRDMNKDGPNDCGNLRNLGWRQRTINLSSYAGSSITLRFENWNRYDNWYNTYTYVDDVQIVP